MWRGAYKKNVAIHSCIGVSEPPAQDVPNQRSGLCWKASLLDFQTTIQLHCYCTNLTTTLRRSRILVFDLTFQEVTFPCHLSLRRPAPRPTWFTKNSFKSYYSFYVQRVLTNNAAAKGIISEVVAMPYKINDLCTSLVLILTKQLADFTGVRFCGEIQICYLFSSEA